MLEHYFLLCNVASVEYICCLGVLFGGCWSIVVASVSSSRQGICFLFICLISFLALCILHVSVILSAHRLGVNHIFVILIYFLYQENTIKNVTDYSSLDVQVHEA
jgi:hypothetical protein